MNIREIIEKRGLAFGIFAGTVDPFFVEIIGKAEFYFVILTVNMAPTRRAMCVHYIAMSVDMAMFARACSSVMNMLREIAWANASRIVSQTSGMKEQYRSPPEIPPILEMERINNPP
jgi:hypothetical protein